MAAVMTATRQRRLIIGIGSSGLVLATVTIVGCVMARIPWSAVVESYALTNTVIGLGFLAAGFTIGWNRPRNALGRLFLVCAIGHLITAATVAPLRVGLESGWPSAVLITLTGLESAWLVGIIGLFPLALLLFPDGHLPSRRWRPLAMLIVVQLAVQLVVDIWYGTVLNDPALNDPTLNDPTLNDPQLNIPRAITTSVLYDSVSNVVNLVVVLAVLASLILRFVRGSEQVRRQLLWLTLAVIVLVVLNSQRWITGDGPILLLLSFVLIPIAITIAVVQHQLLDIRLVVSRTLLYLAVSVVAIACYAGLVAVVSGLVPADYGRGVTVGAALVVAVGFNPLRVLLQTVIDRAFYGTRADPVVAISQLGAGLENDVGFESVLEGVRATLRLPSLELRTGGDTLQVGRVGPVAAVGASCTIPLVYRGRDVGEIVVVLRKGEQVLHERDALILGLVATPLAIALHSQGLTEQVTASRAALVGAHEEERLRLHREMHDGLGPTLTGAAFRADAAQNLLLTDPDSAGRLLVEVRQDVRKAVDDVRRVVYGLRPVDLDERGLLGALQDRAAAAYRSDLEPLTVRVTANEGLEGLPAAVEIGAYRIVNEAVANVLRHTRAALCEVSLVRADGNLRIRVTDDGSSGSSWQAGVGVRSLIARADELGGWATAGPVASGGQVLAVIPLPATTHNNGDTGPDREVSPLPAKL